MKRERKRAVVLTNIRSYHQVDFFDSIAASGDVALKVIYLKEMTQGRHWKNLPEPKHDHVMMKVLFQKSPFFLNPGLLRVLNDFGPDLLVVCQYYGIAYQAAMTWAAVRRVPFVFWSESPGVKHFEVKSGIPPWLKPAARKAAFFPAKRWAAEVWGIGKRAQAQYEELTGRPCENLPYYSDLSKFDRGSEPYAPEGVVRFLYAGRYSFRKGFDLLLEALASVAARRPEAQWTLTLAGAGDLGPMLQEERFEAVRERTTDLGFLELSEMPALMRRHDVFLCPSRYDGWGMVVPEALAAGMPVVASDEMGSALDLGGRECLRLFASGSAEAFAGRIEMMLGDVAALPRLGADARTAAMSYDAPRGAERFAEMAMRTLEPETKR